MFPGVAILTPLFQLFSDWGWLGTYQGLIVPQISGALPLAVFVLTSFFTDMPWELEQAARVDGATPGQAFRLVILPLAAPALFTCRHPHLPGGLERVPAVQSTCTTATTMSRRPRSRWRSSPPARTSSRTRRRWPPALIVVIPLIIVVLLFQRRIVSGLTAGGVKG